MIMELMVKCGSATVVESGMRGNTAEQALQACSAVSSSYEG